MKQLYPTEPQGTADNRHVARHLNTLAGMVTGIVLGKSRQLPTLASKAPDATLAESRGKRFSRWLQNETVTAETNSRSVPFIEALLTRRRRGAGAAIGLHSGRHGSRPRLFGPGDQRRLWSSRLPDTCTTVRCLLPGSWCMEAEVISRPAASVDVHGACDRQSRCARIRQRRLGSEARADH